jgi:hypothetical protein
MQFVSMLIQNVRVQNVRMGLLCGCLLAAFPLPAEGADRWLGFRGPGGRSAALDAHPPVEFDVDQGQNVAWQVETSGRSVGGMVILDDTVIVTGSGGEDQRDIFVEGFDAQTGRRRWVRPMRALGRPYTHPTSANASPTPASDGERVFALFSSCDLVCVDAEGRVLWYRALAVDYPKAGNDISMSSSPAVIDGVVMVQLENQGDSFALGLDTETGETLWRRARPRSSNWSSPIAVETPQGEAAFVLQQAARLDVLAADDGETLHSLEIPCDTTASSAWAPPLLLVPSDGLTALELTEDSLSVAWQNNRLRSQRCSSVIAGNRVYCGRGSVLVAGDLEDGSVTWQTRLPEIGSVWATPIATASGIYVFDQSGKGVVVVDRGDAAEVVAEFDIKQPVLGSPAVSGEALYLRTERGLIKLASTSE